MWHNIFIGWCNNQKELIMKKTSINFLSLVIAGSMFVYSCGDGDKSTSTTTSADSSSMGADKMSSDTGMSSTTSTNPDQQAINTTVTKNTKELAWLYAGIDKGTSKDVKEHARMILTDHKKMEADVMGLISKKGWSIPTVDTMNEVTINNLTGKEWDKAWTDKMVVDHADILAKLQSSQTSVKDDELRALIAKNIPVVQGHLNMVKAIQTKLQ